MQRGWRRRVSGEASQSLRVGSTGYRHEYLGSSIIGSLPTCFIDSANPLAIWAFRATLTSLRVTFSRAGRTEFWMTFFTADSTTRVVFLVNSVEMSFKIFSCRSKSAV